MIEFLPDNPQPPLRKPWKRAIAVGRAYELLREDVVRHLRTLQSRIGFEACRFHGLLHDEMGVVVRRPDGELAFQWHQLDKVFDSLRSLGLRPFIELGPMPAALASGTQTIFHWEMNVTPPRSYADWARVVGRLAAHLVERYGLEEVRRWHFEVWNEPNLPGFWTGTREDYQQLYHAAAMALKQVDAELRVGGPVTARGAWIGDFIRQCAARETPLDFVSTHLYPQDEYVHYPGREGSPHAPGRFFEAALRGVADEIRASPMPRLPLHVTEWNALSGGANGKIDWISNPSVDGLYAAGCILHNAAAMDRALATLCHWSASDVFEEASMPHAPFSGTYGLLTVHGIPKASFHAFDLLNRLRGPVLLRGEAALPPYAAAVATREGGSLHALAWLFAPLELTDQPGWSDVVRLPVDSDEPQMVTTVRVAAGAGSAYETWCAIGRPHNLSDAQLSLLRAHATPAHAAAIHEPAGRRIDVALDLRPGEIVYLEATPLPHPAMPKNANHASLTRWNSAMGARST